MKQKRTSVHRVKVEGKEYTHRGDLRDCIICHGKAPGVSGEKTGGKW